MQIVLFVLDDPDRWDEVPDAWDNIGISGVTFIESTGINRRWLARVERRLFFLEADALLILIGYLLGMWFLYSRGLGV